MRVIRIVTQADCVAWFVAKAAIGAPHIPYPTSVYSPRVEGLEEQIRQLGPSPTVEQINEVLGNSSWTDLVCDECGQHAQKIAIVGQPLNHDSATTFLCGDCIKAACAYFDEGEN